VPEGVFEGALESDEVVELAGVAAVVVEVVSVFGEAEESDFEESDFDESDFDDSDFEDSDFDPRLSFL
jgi:hypothetical protein